MKLAGDKIDKDTNILAQFIDIYCKHKHPNLKKTPWERYKGDGCSEKQKNILLCQDCMDLLDYSANRRRHCPLDPKPTCKNCEIHCYNPEKRAKIRAVMRYSGIQMIKRGRIDMIYHYFF